MTNVDYELYLNKFEGGEISIDKTFWHEGLAIIFINNPDKRNAITGKMMVDFRRCIEQLDNWFEGKGVLLMGKNGNFCSGGDLNFAKQSGREGGAIMTIYMQETLNRFRKLPLITVSVANGPTLGGGAEIAIHSDQLLVVDNAKLGFVHGKMGIITAWGGTTRLVQLIGEKKSLDLLLTSKILNADECLQIGLANAIISETNYFNESINWIKNRIKHDASLIKAFKLSVSAASTESYENSILIERQLIGNLWGAPLNCEALGKNIKHVENATIN